MSCPIFKFNKANGLGKAPKTCRDYINMCVLGIENIFNWS